MFENVEQLKSEICSRDPVSFVSHHIFEPVPFLFGNDLARWIEWKEQFADLIEVDARDIVLTGSASIGFSLNPNKGFKAFDGKSDIDCGVISAYHFDVSWRFLRQQRVAWLTLPKATKDAIRSHRQYLIFSGTIATDWMLGVLPFGSSWQAAVELIAELPPAKGRDIRMRIYRDFESLRYYQANNLSRLRQSIEAGDAEADAEDIGVDPVEEAV